ncbi:MAG: ABC transporter ATP-binding protein [Bryobacterales bacterium]|nr:ABC transporter ATP-binding protein [Bryobacteraceae bacterium]MDW8355201.1 ABC transporter ATP-binding protein [Bryobacterales bacterium]
MTEPLLQATQVEFRRGYQFCLRLSRLEAHRGEMIAVLGRNGSGKSTLVNLLAGLLAPSVGEIRVAGQRLATLPARQRPRWICHLPQLQRTELGFTVEQIVLMGRYASAEHWFESERDEHACLRALERLALTEFRNRRISTLSGGERQRVFLAACLAQEAQIWLLDEPVTFLDVEHQLAVMELLRQECEQGRLIVTVLHDVNLALRYGTRLILLEDGNLAADLSREEAVSSRSWLARLSPRLRLELWDQGQAWVRY